jgi:hypothetical protein
MPLFTIILDFKGGTYIGQVKAATPSAALCAWAVGLDPVPIKHFGPARKKQLVAEVEWRLENGLSPTPLTGLKNAWCAGCCPGGGLINMVRTDQAEQESSSTE